MAVHEGASELGGRSTSHVHPIFVSPWFIPFNSAYIPDEGHTIYALHGGIFANIYNTSNIKIENCYLKNFTEDVVLLLLYMLKQVVP